LENQAQGKGYGPCKNSLCGCDCHLEECICTNDESSLVDNEKGFKFLSASTSGRKGARDSSGQIDVSLVRIKDFSGEVRFLSGSAIGEIKEDSIGFKLGADLASIKTDGFEMRAGLNVDTGITLEDGLQVKAGGFGIILGNQVGVSLPFGEVKVDTDKCNVQ